MQIVIRELPQDGNKKRYEGREDPSILEIQDEGEYVKAEKPIGYELAACVVSGRLIVGGKVWTEVFFRCSRCSEYFRSQVLDRQFERIVDLSTDMLSVDLTGDIRESILLHFPGYPVCREDCKGLCVQCGTNLNEKACGCHPRYENRWEALEKLSQLGGPKTT